MTVSTIDFRRPSNQPLSDWFSSLVHSLLNGARLLVAGEPHRLVEVETYYHSPDHPDPFSHRDPLQLEFGQWYFHRTGGGYRSGSFKGLDVTFGDGTAYGGILFRSLETPDGTLINGPSLLVDYLLKKTGHPTVASLDQAIAKKTAWQNDNVIQLQSIDDMTSPIFTTARVGLSLKKIKATAENGHYLLQPYRYLTEPRKIAKGKVLLVLALLQKGLQEDEIAKRTGCPLSALRRYTEAYREGTAGMDLAAFAGRNFGTRDLCLLHGYGKSVSDARVVPS